MKRKRDTFPCQGSTKRICEQAGKTCSSAQNVCIRSFFLPLHSKEDFEIASSEEFWEKETSVAPSSVTHLLLQETFEKGKLDISQATLHGFPSAADAGHM